MLLLSILSLSLLSLANYVIARRILYPPVIFCAAWAADLALVWLSGSFFYPVSDKTLVVFQIGCWSFSVGAALALFLPRTFKTPRYDFQASNRIINLLLLTVILSLPFIYRWLASIAAGYHSNLLIGAYLAMSEGIGKLKDATLYGNLMMLSSLVPLLCICERENRGKRALLAFFVACLIQVISGVRSAFVAMTLTMIGIDWMRTGKLKTKLVLPVAAFLLVFVSFLAVVLGKFDASRDVSVGENVLPVVRGLVAYAAGPIPAFSQVVEHPNIVPHDLQPTYYFGPWINRLGGHVEAQPNAQFITIGPDNLLQNVYTMYFVYIDYRYVRMMAFLAAFGFVVTLIYRRACAGHRIALLLYGYFFAGMLLSPYSDYFLMGLPFSIKLFTVGWVVFSLPVMWRRVRELASWTTSHLAAHRYLRERT
jgi:oligosaccharide repeat unit polymerase